MRADAFSKRHPAVNFVFFLGAIFGAALNQHPAYLAAGLFGGAFYYRLLHGRRGWRFIGGLVPLFLAFTAVNPLFNTGGDTVLFTYFDRPYTLEALLYGAALAAVFANMLLWFGCYNAVLTGDKFTSLFGNLAPALSLLLVMVLRMIPNFLRRARQIAGARASIGLGVSEQESRRKKLAEGMTVLGTLTSWALEGSVVTADSMRSRGYGCAKRTSFQRYTMTGADRLLLVLEIALPVLAILLGNAEATYTPVFFLAPQRGAAAFGLAAYAVFLLIPTALHIKETVQWNISISGI